MTSPLVWGSPHWFTIAFALLAVATLSVLWAYRHGQASWRVRIGCAALKAVGFTALALCLVEPLLTGTRARPGANAFVVLADNSQSLLIRDPGESESRGEHFRDLLGKESAWKTRLSQDFDVRRYVFDTHLRAVERFDGMPFDGNGSSLNGSLTALSRRFRGLPLAGVLLLTDGNRTDAGNIDVSALPPIYPVLRDSGGTVRDVGVSNVSVGQTNFEAAPVVLRADVSAAGFEGETIVAAVIDEAGNEVERQTATVEGDGRPLNFRFQFRPEHNGVQFYTVRAFAASEAELFTQDANDDAGREADSDEPTLANNDRLVVVDQGGGPYRVLYVSGRPNWEYKFLRRAVDEDQQLRLVGLLRIARRQPKFDFQAEGSRTTSPLFEGFDNPDDETAERYDEPVLVRIGTEDEAELRDGFPQAAAELYRYHAVILDDLEAAFFTQDQQALLRNFVSVRGGGLLMLGGPDAFADGDYARTPVGELLPVYLNKPAARERGRDYRLVLTREGWLQPWVRTRETEESERQRLAAMPAFNTLSRASVIKPGAAVLAQVRDSAGNTLPALVAQPFGRGQVGALLIGDLWRWRLRRTDPEENDFDRSWRQTVRWLVSDVPRRVEIDIRPEEGSAASAMRLEVRVRDAEYRPLDNAQVALELSLPDGETMTIDAQPAGREAGNYAATFVPRLPGAYRVTATVTAPDGSLVGDAEAGWAAQPAAEEFARLETDRDFLQELASSTGGEIVDADSLDTFVAGLAARDAPVTEPWTAPLWHHPLYFLIAIGCLVSEWGLRRVKGLS